MRRLLPFLLAALLFAPAARAADVGDISDPGFVNYLIDHVQAPDLAPGEQGRLSFAFTNPYPWPSAVMTNISLTLQAYRYREIGVDLPVEPSWPGPDFVDDAGVRGTNHAIEPLVAANLTPGESTNVSFTVLTYPETRHGSITSQGSYFVRTRLAFDLGQGPGMNHSVMMSKGWFSDAEFEAARLPENSTCAPSVYCVGLLNLTYLGSRYGLDHLDGFLPETGFSVQERLPVWPFVAVGGVMVASLVFAVLFYAEENPGRMPRLARWWLGVRGKVRRPRRPPKE